MDSLSSAHQKELGGIVLGVPLGEGGMGAVYFSVTPDGEPVAVKTIRDDLPSHPVLKERFRREMAALGMARCLAR